MSFEECFENDREQKPKQGKFPENYEPALELIEQVRLTLDTVEDTNHSPIAEDYIDSTRTTMDDFESSINEWKSATPNQVNALRNILRGAERWCR